MDLQKVDKENDKLKAAQPAKSAAESVGGNGAAKPPITVEKQDSQQSLLDMMTFAVVEETKHGEQPL